MTAQRTLIIALGKILLIFAVAVAFLLGMVGTVYLSLRSPEVHVPEVTKQSRWNAETALDKAGLHMRVRATRFARGTQPDTVLNQSPQPGEIVKAGQTVAVVVSRAPGKDDDTTVPAVAEEMPAANANQNASAAAQNSNVAKNANDNRPKNRNVNKNSNNANANNANANRNANAANANRNNNMTNRNANANNANHNAVNVNRNTTNVNRRPLVIPATPSLPRTTTPPQ